MRVLFVDDEPQVLKGITRMLDAADVDWDIETAESGPTALEMMTDESFDVVVSDMRMPGMDGAALLEEVSKLHPETVRIVLSGQAEKEAVYRAIRPMHQYLAKPCEPEVLQHTISRACALREMIDTTKSHQLLGRISSLPSLPSLYQQVVEEIDSPNGTVAGVGEIVAKDVAMTAKILQLSNSAMVGARSPVTTPVHAASLLGMEHIKSLVLSLQVFTSCGKTTIPGFSIDDLMDHSLRVATITQTICKTEKLSKSLSSEAFTAGLLHDVGKLILATEAPEEFGAALTLSKTENLPLVECEKREFGLAHDGIGGYLLALWGIPQTIVEAVAFHHQPERVMGHELDAATLTFLANTLANENSAPLSDAEQAGFTELLDSLGLTDNVDVWRNQSDEAEE